MDLCWQSNNVNLHLIKISQSGKWETGVAFYIISFVVLEGNVFNQQVWSWSVLARTSGCCPGYSQVAPVRHQRRLPSTSQRRVRIFWLFYEFQFFKCLFYPQKRPRLLSENKLINQFQNTGRKPAIGPGTHTAYLSSHLHTPTHFQPVSILSWRFACPTCFIYCCTSNRAEQQTKNLFFHTQLSMRKVIFLIDTPQNYG